MKIFVAGLSAALALSAGARADEGLATGPHRFAVDGVRQWYRVAGRTTGTPVVFLHGGPAEGSQGFARTVGPLLERRLRMVYLDQRGAGHSDRPDAPSAYSLVIIVGDVERLRRALGVDRIALIGHSYGSAVALEYAARFPTRVTRVVLVGAVPDSPAALNLQCVRLKRDDPAAYARAKAAANKPGDPDCVPFEGFSGKDRGAYFARTAGGRQDTLEKLAAADAAEGVEIGGPAGMLLADPFLSYRFTRAAALTMPVLAIAGGADRLTDAAPVRPFVAGLKQGRMIVYPQAGHFAFVDEPARFAGDVAGFLDGTGLPSVRRGVSK